MRIGFYRTTKDDLYRWLVLVLLASLLTINVTSMQHISRTYDEAAHLRYGQNILNLDSTRFDDSKMPVSVLNALPAKVLSPSRASRVETRLAEIAIGRYVTVIFSLLVTLCVLRWTRELYGPSAGLLALTLYTFEPNLLAHSQLITTDLYVTGAITISLYVLWRFLDRGGWVLALLSALMLGLSQLTKYTALMLFPLFALIVLGRCAPVLYQIARERRFEDLARRLFHFFRLALLFILVSLVVINAGFLFHGTLTPLKDYQFRSTIARSIQFRLSSLGNIPVPVPYPYLEGLDWVLEREGSGEGYGNLYLLGEIRPGGHGFKGYFLYATLFKVPIATQLFVLAAAVAYLVRRRCFDFFKNEWVFVCPILVFTIYFNFFFGAQIGIRFFLIVFPLLFIFCGSLLKGPASLPRSARYALAGAITFLLLSTMSYYPHFLSYFNELVWDRRGAYRILADSNLDWGQHQHYFDEYRKTHPESIFEPRRPTAGTIIVRANWLTGVLGAERFRWLRENFQPVDHVAYSYLVFKVSSEDLERIR